MTETVVHVTTLEQWKSVLDVWFKQGYAWPAGDKKYSAEIFESGGRFLFLGDYITYSMSNPDSKPFIEFSEFMEQQKEDNKMEKVYEVSQSVFDELQRIKAHEGISLIGAITLNAQFIKSINVGKKAILRYLADDPAIEFKVKEQLYRLSGTDEDDDEVYMTFNCGIPTWTYIKDNAFTAPLEEIKKWQTPAWEIEKVGE
ncbi:hypothetical protein ABGW26_08230 [Leuconostoc falkenbergense]|uniref:hypothetical protein n=1 Tax=Leuconostoc TaxID=1243 RepID=UPI0002738B83|nr:MULTISPECIES: hypothetical protein [Leuconostoc]KDA48755.1 hypothetical protein L964_1974 [Leuconostoc pseudomesenteroides 1159]KDA50487.1 hypothetical protein L965_1877 [Leuconostoc pseudomesenteroides PS12]OQJ69940.1 hypothetical protein BMS79_07830 [Leuconostoc pseudomesenteroides]CCJ66949.1 hypothetical protein Q5C_06010 [Leuconostoc pseudomesenteroides 4882]MDG9745586.1 hypothetical protein [Leuconostoc falkenbergense]